MDVMRITRFQLDPDVEDEFVRRRAAMVAAVYDECPGLLDTMLTRIDPSDPKEPVVCIDLWWWESDKAQRRAAAKAPGIPEVSAAFALVSDVSAETAEIVSPR